MSDVTPATATTPRRARSARVGKGAHLSDAAEALLLQHLIAGDSNAAACAALIDAGHLKGGENLSRQTLWRYRRDPRYLEAQGVVARESNDAGIRALARATIGHADLVDAALLALIDPQTGGLNIASDPMGVARYLAALQTLEVSCKFLVDKLASGDLVTALRSFLERTEGVDVRDERLRMELRLEIQRSYNAVLRGMIVEARGEKPERSVVDAIDQSLGSLRT
jgi:hypothetical protein